MNRLLLSAARRLKAHVWSCALLSTWLGCGFMALKSASRGWEMANITITATLILFAVSAGMFGGGRFRVFWSGFALSGCGYLALLFGWNQVDDYRLVDDLGTTRCLEYLFRQFNPKVDELFPWPKNSYRPIFYHTQYQPGVVGSIRPVKPPPRVSITSRHNPSAESPSKSTAVVEDAAKTDYDTTQNPASEMSPSNAVDAANPQSRQADLDELSKLIQSTVKGSTGWENTLSVKDGGGRSLDDELDLYNLTTERLESFPRIGHCLFALLFGWLGGGAARRMAGRGAMPRGTPLASPGAH